MSSLTIGKEVHNTPIMKIPDTSAAHHLNSCGFNKLATALKGKMGYHPISDLVYTLLSHIPMETSSAFDEADKLRKKVNVGATEPANLFGVSFLSFKVSMYPKKIPVTCKKRQHGIAYPCVKCHLDGKLYDARVEQEPLDNNFCLKLSQSSYYKESDTFVALLELTRKRKHQSPRRNAKIGLLFNDDYDNGRLDNVKRQLY